MIKPALNPTTGQTAGQMTWRLPGQREPLLHLRSGPLAPWQPYTSCPQYAVPDRPFLSAGYATFVHLLRQNWEVVVLERRTLVPSGNAHGHQVGD
jgi:hypothetical protein